MFCYLCLPKYFQTFTLYNINHTNIDINVFRTPLIAQNVLECNQKIGTIYIVILHIITHSNNDDDKNEKSMKRKINIPHFHERIILFKNCGLTFMRHFYTTSQNTRKFVLHTPRNVLLFKG